MNISVLYALGALCIAALWYVVLAEDRTRSVPAMDKIQFKYSFLQAVQNSDSNQMPYRKGRKRYGY